MGEFLLDALIFVMGCGLWVLCLLAALGSLYAGIMFLGMIVFILLNIILYPVSKLCALYARFVTGSFTTYDEARDYYENLFQSKLDSTKETEKKVEEKIKDKIKDNVSTRRNRRKEKKDAKTK